MFCSQQVAHLPYLHQLTIFHPVEQWRTLRTGQIDLFMGRGIRVNREKVGKLAWWDEELIQIYFSLIVFDNILHWLLIYYYFAWIFCMAKIFPVVDHEPLKLILLLHLVPVNYPHQYRLVSSQMLRFVYGIRLFVLD